VTLAQPLATGSIAERRIVWDNHACFPLDRPEALEALDRYVAAGTNILSINVGYGAAGWDAHLATLTAMRGWIAARSDRYRLVDTVADVRACLADGRLGIVFDVEGMVPVVDDPRRVATLYGLGVRWMLIAYNRDNPAGGGCMDAPGGLTALGRAIIDEMERVGMVLCLSHTSERTAREALDYASAPPIFSHSNPAGHTPHVRNISDELMHLCAAKGGVIGVSGIGPFLGASQNLVAALLDQLRYVIDRVGPAHVGLGLDYVVDTTELEAHVRANPSAYPAGVDGGIAMVPPEAMGAIVDGLCRDNLREDEVRMVLGGNWLRIAEQVWK
jgi:membrane dipeptidase